MLISLVTIVGCRDTNDETASSASPDRESHLLENVNLVDLGDDEMITKAQSATTAGPFQQSHNLE